jgi:hypothetical protein
LDPKRAMKYVDENTVGVFVILGSKLGLFCWGLSYRWGIQAPTRDIMSLSRKCPTFWMNMRHVPGTLFLFMVGFCVPRTISLLLIPLRSWRRFWRVCSPICDGECRYRFWVSCPWYMI